MDDPLFAGVVLNVVKTSASLIKPLLHVSDGAV
jgi:hypothetical protein